MATNTLSSKLQMAIRRITGRGFLNEADIDLMMREVRLSLLEADVNFKVVKSFTSAVKEKAIGEKILKGLNPGQQVVKVVFDELKSLMGDEQSAISYNLSGLTTIMAIGLQGTGKTTSVGKLASYIKKNENKKVMIIAADIYRPAAIEQLKTIGESIETFVFEMGQKDVLKIVKSGMEYAKKENYDCVIIDTAGRLYIDDQMMKELVEIKSLVKPDEILLTVDAMTGQEAANIAKSFHEIVGATGAILTKLDGDTRGGAALSIKEVSGIPIKFMSSGEKMETFEVFHPERMASRILGMGDVLTLIEETTNAIDEDEALSMMEKMTSGKFNYDDLLKQFKMMKRMGSISRILGFIPGLGKLREATSQIDETKFYKTTALISSMTKEERKHPDLINKSSQRRERIAKGAGMAVSELNKLRQTLDAQISMGKKVLGMNENEIKNFGNNKMNFAPKVSQKKGKGKNKGLWKR